MSTAKNDFSNRIPEALERMSGEASAIDATIVVAVVGDGGGVWTLHLNEALRVEQADHGSPDARFELDAESWAILSQDPKQMAPLFFAGRVKVEGNAMYGLKLPLFLGA